MSVRTLRMSPVGLTRPRARRVVSVVTAGAMACGLMLSFGLARTASAAGGSTITIGLDMTQSGPDAPGYAGVYGDFMAWIDYTNSHGGLSGHKVKVDTLDDKGDDGQALLNYQTLWTEDHAVLIAKLSTATMPYALIKQDSIPTISYTGDPRMYASYYPTILPMGDNIPEVGAEVAYWYTHIENKHPKRVAVLYEPAYSSWNNFLVRQWKKDGATEVDMIPSGATTASCSATIVQIKSKNIQFFDLEGTQAVQCIDAEQTLGWKPSMGEGGSAISSIGTAELIGKSLAGVVAGSPNSLYNGEPIYAKPSASDLLYAANVKKYNPGYYNYSYLNGTSTIIGYGLAELATALVGGVLKSGKEVTPADIVSYGHGLKNWSSGLQPPVKSFATNCKSGSDGTIWGYWRVNPKPTPFKPALYLQPTSGHHWIDGALTNVSECELTTAANAAYPHG
jgi:ABC-type branched-subunit amino acid transport system substrate-binding protein